MFDKVYYVSYGSNLLQSRFQEYLDAHYVDMMTGEHLIPESAPVPSVRVNLARDIYYAYGSHRWGGGIAFLDIDTFSAKKVYRAWELHINQFYSVFSQENGWCDDLIDWDELLTYGIHDTSGGMYDRIVLLGWVEGIPALTFTSSTRPAAHTLPGPAYTDVINRGRKETRKLEFRALSDSLYA